MSMKELVTAATVACLVVTLTVAAPSEQAKTPKPPATRPVATRPAASQPQESTTVDKGIRFQFDGESFPAVVGRFARMVNKPLIGEMDIDGTLTFYDSEPYTYEEALEALNLILETRGYALIDTGRYLRVIQLDKVPEMPLKVITDPSRVGDVRPSEIVTIMIPLKVIDASEAHKAISPLVSSFGTSTALRKGKGLIITDRLDNILRISSLLETLDIQTIEDRELKSFTLKHASAASVANVLKGLFTAQGPKRVTTSKSPKGPRRKRTKAPRAPSGREGKLTVTYDQRTNTVLLVGTPQVLAMAEQIIMALDEPQAASGGDMRIYELKNANAEDLADVIRQALPRRTGPKPKKGQAPTYTTGTIVADPVSNRLIVSVPMEMLAKIEKLILELDEAASAQATTKLFHLVSADAEQLARILPRAVSKRGTRGKMISKLSASADPRTNTLMVSGSVGDIKTAQAIIAELDEPIDTDRQIRVVKLQGGDATAIARSLQRLMGQQTKTRGGRGQFSKFRVEADAASNALIISAGTKDFPVIQDILDELTEGVSASEPTIRQIQLRYAKATELEGMLKSIFTRGRRSRRRGAPEQTVTIAASKRNNNLIVRASPDEHQSIMQLVTSLDVPETAQIKPTSMIQLETANAERLVATLKAMLPRTPRGKEPDVFIQAEPLTNTILLRAPQTQRQMLEQMIATLDKATQNKARETRILKLKNVSAGKLAQTIRQLYASGASSGSRRRGRTGPGVAGQVTISAAPGDKTLVVDAPRDKIEQIAQLVAALDGEGISEQMELRTYDVGSSDAAQLARSLSKLFAQRRGDAKLAPRFETDGASNQLIVAAPADRFDEIEDVLESLKGATKPICLTKTFYLKAASASEVAPALEEMLRDRAARRRGRRGTPSRVAGTEIRIAAVRFANAILIKAPPEVMEQAAKLIQDLDIQAGGAQPVVKTYPLIHAEVSTAVDTLRQLFASPARSRRGRRSPAAEGPIVITGDEAAKAILVSAPPDKHELIAKTIEQIDTPESSEGSIVRVYKITHGEARTMSSALTQTLSTTSTGRAGRGRPVATGALRISADSGSNSIVVRASETQHEEIAKLIEEMDTPPAAKMPVRTVKLNNANADRLAQTLKRMFVTPSARRGRRGPQAPSVAIEADASSGVLMVRADDETFEKIVQIVQSLDHSDVAADQTLIQLEHARASAIAPVLARAFAPKRGQRLSSNELVTVVPEPNSNALIISANEKNLLKLQSLLAKLDTPEAGGTKTELLLLENSKATDLADVLRKLVGTQRTRRRRGAETQEPVLVSADDGSNALIISGPPDDVAALMKTALQLDQATTSKSSQVYVIQLENGRASDVAETVQNIYNQQVAHARRNRRSIEPLAVSADDRANAIILAASQQMYEQVSQWIEQVEKMKPTRGAPRVIKLQYADPAEVEQAIQQLYGSGGGGSGGSNGRTRRTRSRRSSARASESDSRINTTILTQQRAILIDATDEEYEQILKLVQTLEQAAKEAVKQVKIFTLKHASNTRVATALNNMYKAMRTDDPRDQVSIIALQKTNAVVVSAAPEKMEQVAGLIEQLDKEEVAPQLDFRIYPLAHATPSKILPILQKMLKRVQEFRPDQIVDVQADDRTRAIIITARADVFDPIDKIIKMLDEAPTHAATEVLIIPLKRADAEQLAKVLNEMLRPSPTGQVTKEALALQEQIRRLRVHSTLTDQVPELDLTKPIKISADPARPQGSNSIILSSTSENLKALRAIVEIMDTVPIAAGVKVRLVPLNNADAESVMKILQEIFAQGKSLAGKPGTSVAGKAEPTNTTGKALVSPPNISADTRTNTLIISGQEDSIALAEAVARDLDRNQGKISTDVRLFKLKDADAARLVPILQAVFSEGPVEPGSEGLHTHVTRLRTILDGETAHTTKIPKARAALTIQADPYTNIIIVAARWDVIPLIADVIKTMDIPGAGSLNTVRIFPLIHADATRITQVIASLYTGANAKYVRDEDKPTIAVDTRTNALVVSASEKTFALLDSLLARLDTKLPLETREIRLVPLANADAGSLEPVLQKIMDARVQRQQSLGIADAEALRVIIVADPRSNSLIVAGSPESYDIIKSLAEQLDSAAPALSGRIQVLALTHGNAGTIGTTLNDLFRQRYQSARAAEVQRLQPIIVPDLRTNSLLVAAGPDDTQIIKTLLMKLDRELLDPTVQLVVIPLKFNDAGIVAQTIQTIFAARLQSMTLPGQTPAPQDRVDVATDSLTNSLIVSASKENLSLVRGLLAKVDIEPPDETGIVRMYFLKNCDAQRVATMIKSLVTQGLYKPGVVGVPASPRIAGREKVAIEVDIRTNVLIVSASRENFAVIEEIIRRIDSSADFGALGDIRLYRIKHADATKIAPTLQQFFTAKLAAEKATGASGRSLPVSIIADARSNTLLVAGSPESFAAVEQMIERLDKADATRITEIRVFELNQADASELAKILTDVLTAKPASTAEEDPNRQTMLQFVTRDETGSVVITQGMREGLLIIPDVRNNSVVVSAPVSNMPMLAALIKSMDSTSPRSANIRVFALKNADARRMAEVLKQLFRLQEDTNSSRSVQYTLVSTHPAGADPSASTTVGTDEQYALSVTVDVRTNSLLIGGTEHQVQMASKVIEQLDSSPAQERVAKVYRLRNARAADIEKALRSFLDQERQNLVSTLGDEGIGAAQRLLEREVAVVAVASEGEEEKSNTLLLSASPRYFKIVEEMIKELDQPPAQVRVQVLLAEVLLDDKTELGIDWNFTGTFDSSTLSAGTNFGVSAGTAGFNIAITGGDLSFFLRALQAQGRLEILSRPQILTCDNQQGEVKVGQRVPFIRESRVTESGTTLNTIQYEDVGINLLVTPRINPDGFVRLEVEPEISQLSESTIQVSEGVNAIIVNSRSAKTTVTVQDGHTIIIGGLITTREENREDKVPFFGDLPLVGNLFKSTKIVKERAELLIILTPHILRNTTDIDTMTQREIQRMRTQGQVVRQYKQQRDWLNLLEAVSPVKPYESDWEDLLRELEPEEAPPVPLEMLPDSKVKTFGPEQ